MLGITATGVVYTVYIETVEIAHIHFYLELKNHHFYKMLHNSKSFKIQFVSEILLKLYLFRRFIMQVYEVLHSNFYPF